MQNRMSAFDECGFSVINDIYSPEEIAVIGGAIEQVDTAKPTFRKSKELFAIRQFLREIPKVFPLIFNAKLRSLIDEISSDAFVVKSIYFDKPAQSNWFVAWHQDLTISVKERKDTPGFGPWTIKQNQFAVQPPLPILENIFTVRIHLDETDSSNGALRVVPGSHRKGILLPHQLDWEKEESVTCDVAAGGVMLMKPLLLHSSARSNGNHRRRVIHIEFSNVELPDGLSWAELEML